ncbi:hypothetical protein B0T25DRAFT_597144, partial [Lasiosphaeria hispida]
MEKVEGRGVESIEEVALAGEEASVFLQWGIHQARQLPNWHSGNCISTLRNEIITALDAHGGQWTKASLAEMTKLDSAIRESQRLSATGLL